MDPYFDYAGVLLQIALVMSSIASWRIPGRKNFFPRGPQRW